MSTVDSSRNAPLPPGDAPVSESGSAAAAWTPGAWYHLAILAGTAAVMAAAILLRVHRERYVSIGSFPLPELCLWKQWWGVDCPGCGLTRSFISMAHFRLADAFRFHPVGPFLFAVGLAQFPYRAVQLVRKARGLAPLNLRASPWMLWALVAALFLQWAVRMAL